MPETTAFPFTGRFHVPTASREDARRLGNQLRRFLLSEIEGMAVTAVRIDGVIHEYQAVPGVREDALELINNLKQVRVRAAGDTVRATLDATGAVVKAGDISLESGEVIDPDFVIAHLSPGSRLKLEILFERGKGFQVSGRVPEGFIPVFAKFNPVRKVGVNVEDGGLIIAIETDGSITPESALRQAAQELGVDTSGVSGVGFGDPTPSNISDKGTEFGDPTSSDISDKGTGFGDSAPSIVSATSIDLGLEFRRDPFMGMPPEFRDLNKESYTEFLEMGIQRLLNMLFPLVGQTQESTDQYRQVSSGGRRLDLISYKLQTPDRTPMQCLGKDLTYEGRLIVAVRVKRGPRDDVYSQDDPRAIAHREVDMGPIPMMTEDGRFVINGCFRTCVMLLDSEGKVQRVGEMVMQELESLITRMKPILEERVDSSGWLETDILDLLPLSATLCGMLSSANWSQYSDETNPLATITHRTRLSAIHLHRTSEDDLDLRSVKVDQFGRLDYLETPEGPNCGLIHTLSTYAGLNDKDELVTPYRKVEDAKATSAIVHLTAPEEAAYKIADITALDDNGVLRDDWVTVRNDGDIKRVPAGEVQLVSVSPVQSLSYSTSLIPFLGHDDPNRALQGSNMQRQAEPTIRAEQPLVKTGLEARAALASGQMVVAKRSGKVVEAAGERIVVQCGRERDVYELRKFARSNQAGLINARTIVTVGDAVVEGQVLADTSGTCGGEMALGKNVLVAYMPFHGYNFEDAICISDELVADETFTTVNIEHEYVEIGDAEVWVAPTGARLNPGDTLVQEASGRKRTLFVVPPYNPVIVLGGDRRNGRVRLTLAGRRDVSIGDKFAGRHGNKGVVAKVLPRSEMPFMEDGTPVQMVLNTLGVISRMNLGQILEAHYGLLAHKLGTQVVIPPFMTPPHDLLRSKLVEAGLSETGMVTLYDGATGRAFESPVTVGWVYMARLAHMVDDKIHAVSTKKPLHYTGHYGRYWGQKVGSLEMWALEAYNAGCTLQEFLTVKSDDAQGRERAALALLQGENVEPAGEGQSLQLLENALRGLGISVEEER